MLKGHSKGFTLLELIIALTIVAVIVVIIFGALRIGIRAWEKGERDVDVRQRQRIVLDLIKRQLASTVAKDLLGGDGQRDPMKGDSKSIEFVSHIPIMPGNQFGTFLVRYAVRKQKDGMEQLVFHERNAALPGKKTGADQPGEGEFYELIPAMKSIVFEYLKAESGEKASLWQKSWDPAVDKEVPRAVRITLRESDEKAPVYVIAGAGD
jgi:general secretion pathway protein J